MSGSKVDTLLGCWTARMPDELDQAARDTIAAGARGFLAAGGHVNPAEYASLAPVTREALAAAALDLRQESARLMAAELLAGFEAAAQAWQAAAAAQAGARAAAGGRGG